MKKVAIMGLVNWVNYGEQFLANTVEYLVGSDYDTKNIDFRPERNPFGYLIYYAAVILDKILFFWKESARLILFGVKCLCKKYYMDNLQECKAIIFACGSYKYGTQKLWAYYSVAIEVAEQLGIPVMFDAVNIQDYSDSDWRCQCLKQHTNYSCVKVFTTRDGEYGLDKLRSCYLEKESSVYSEAVGDPAFWIPECYQLNRSPNANKIGVNLIRSGIFSDYGYAFGEEQLIDLYCNLFKALDEKGIEWELFTNGLKVDYDTGKSILQKCDMTDRPIIVPQSPRQLVELIAGYKGIIGARLHACICAYSIDVPMVGFIWDEKMLRFAQITGTENNFLSADELTGEALCERIQTVLNGEYNAQIRNVWKQKTEASIKSFLKQYVDTQTDA